MSLIHAVSKPLNFKKIRQLINSGYNIDEHDWMHQSSLYHILAMNRFDVAIYLIKKGLNLNKITYSRNLSTPFSHILCCFESSIIAKYVLKKSKYLTLINNRRVHYCRLDNSTTRYLLKLGYNFHEKDALFNNRTGLILNIECDYNWMNHSNISRFDIYLQTLI